MNLYTHRNFGGNCEHAFRFYEKHLGGTMTVIMKQSQMMPRQTAEQAGKEDGVVHARMSVAGVELIGNDVLADRFLPIRSSYLFLALDSTEDAERVYGVLAEDGQVSMPIAETPSPLVCAASGQVRSAMDHYSSASQAKLKAGNRPFPRTGNEPRRLPSALWPERGGFCRRPDP